MTWTLAVSTVINDEPRILNFLKENQSALKKFDEVLLICQMRGNALPDFCDLLSGNCRIVETNSSGISASRNVGIEHFRSELIWFMDDDTRLVEDLETIKAALAQSRAEINTLRIQDTASERLFREYRRMRRLSALELLQVSSIEITCRRSLFERTGIRFAEWIGVGTSLPSGEENLFLLDAQRRGAEIYHLPLVSHGIRNSDSMYPA